MNLALLSLVEVTALTGAMWIPYVANRAFVRGIPATVGYPTESNLLSPWAQRLRAAHANAVENLVVFATLVLVAAGAGISTPLTVMACQLYLGSRVVHATAYTFAIPWIRTLAFLGGFTAQMMLAWQLLA